MKITYNHHTRLTHWETVDRKALTNAKVQMMQDEACAFLQEQREVLTVQRQKAQHMVTVSVVVIAALLAYIGAIGGAGGILPAFVIYALALLGSGCIVTTIVCLGVLQVKYTHNTHRLPEMYFKEEFYKQSIQNIALAGLERMNNLGVYHGKFIWHNARLLQWGYRVLCGAIIAACLTVSIPLVVSAIFGY